MPVPETTEEGIASAMLLSQHPCVASTYMSDRELVDAVLAGDTDSYRALVDRESRSVVAVCVRILRDLDEAQDVAQDAFVQAYRSLATFRGDGTFGAWIGRIATRMAVARSVAIRQERRADAPDTEPISVDERDNPEGRVVQLEQTAAVRQAIRDLPSDQRQVVEMRFFRDMQLEEIAAETGSPVGTVKSRLHRALARLRDESDLRAAS
jgi:RNA polymerase sigma-70 factor (ECF subfamily)